MERVTGIGGVFFRARDPEALARWYAEHLGVSPPPPTYDDRDWWQEAGPTVWAPMPAESEHFGRTERAWSINFRVRDLNAMVAQLRRAGVPVEIDPEGYPNGRFAATADPEGNPIQLWQPAPDTLRVPPAPPH
ncbi:MAG: VOC family protein [Chloroflexota bacterium]|nr:VOC family protein [Chloroflexota bacterium]